jgi:hypothetical protein
VSGAVRLVLEADRDLPAHVGLPIEGPFAGRHGSDVQCAASAAVKTWPVQEDAGIIDLAGHGCGCALIIGFAGFQEAVACRFTVELHVMGLQFDERTHHGLHIVVIHEMSAVAATPLLHLGCIGVEHPFASLAVDTAMR